MDQEQTAFLASIFVAPDDQTRRLEYADWIDQHDGPAELSAVIRDRHLPPPGATRTAQRTVDVSQAGARFLEQSRGLTGLEEFSRLQCELSSYSGTRTSEFQAKINREYDTLLKSWRRWLPTSVTTLRSLADREACTKDYFSPAITIPTRRQVGVSYRPRAAILFYQGLPEWIECDQVDWHRCGLELLTLFPWLHWEHSEMVI